MSSPFDRLIERFPANPRDRLLSRRIDLREDQPVRPFKGSQEIIKEVPGAAITVGLKNHGERALPAIPNRLHGSLDLHGMMPVIIDH